MLPVLISDSLLAFVGMFDRSFCVMFLFLWFRVPWWYVEYFCIVIGEDRYGSAVFCYFTVISYNSGVIEKFGFQKELSDV